MATYLDYARRDGEHPDRWPNLREASFKPWMGQTAVIGHRPWLVVGFDGEMYDLENELGERMRSNKFEILPYESDNNKIVAASRIEGSPLDAGMRLADCDCGVGGIDFDRETYEWSVLSDEGDVIELEKYVASLENADWKVADTLKEAEMPAYDPVLDVKDHEYYCPDCGSPSTDVSDNVAYCDDCGWHGGVEDLLTEGDMAHDHHEESDRRIPYGDDDWQHGASYPEDSEKNAPDHSPKGHNWPKEVNNIYNACMREDNGRGDTKEAKESSCASIAQAQYKKMKKKQNVGVERSLKIVQEGGKFCVKSGARVLGQHNTNPEAVKQLQFFEALVEKGNLAFSDVFSADGGSVSDRKDNVEILKCPDCGSHTVEQTNTQENDFHCLACGNTFKHEVINNPSSPSEKKGTKKGFTPHEEDESKLRGIQDAYERDHGPEYECPKCGDARVKKDGDMYKCEGCGEKFKTPKKVGHIELVTDSDGKPVTGGQYYNLHGDKYKIPDVIKVLEIKDGHIIATIEDNSTPLKISADDIQKEGYSFEALPIYSNIEKHDWREAVSWADDQAPALHQPQPQSELPDGGHYNPSFGPDAQGQEFTLPTPSGGTLWVKTDEAGHVSGWSVPSYDGGPGEYSNRDLEKIQSMVDGARADAVREPSGVQDWGTFQGKTARRAFTPAQQKKLIEEKGSARNKDKLRLDDSHYTESSVEDDLDFLF